MKKGIDFWLGLCYYILTERDKNPTKKEDGNMNKEIKWEFVQEVSVVGISYKEYVSEDGKFGRMVYNDGYEEIYEIAE